MRSKDSGEERRGRYHEKVKKEPDKVSRKHKNILKNKKGEKTLEKQSE